MRGRKKKPVVEKTSEDSDEGDDPTMEDASSLGEEETPGLLSRWLPKKGGLLWRLYQRHYHGIHVYEGLDTSIYEGHMTRFAFLGLRRNDIVRLLNMFLKIDGDRSGHICEFEFLMAVDIERTAFSMRIFSIFDKNNSDEIDFVEFVLAIWNFCSLPGDNLCAFAFRCFAKQVGDGKWKLDQNDCEVLVNAIYGDLTCKERRVTEMYLENRIRKCGFFPFDEWKEWTRHNARALFPIFSIQRQMRRRCLGTRFWKRQAKTRKALFGNMDWTEIERKLDAANIERYRKVVNFESDQTPKVSIEDIDFDDDDFDDDANVVPSRRRRENLNSRGSDSVETTSALPPVDDTDAWLRMPTPKQPRRRAQRQKPKMTRIVENHGYQQIVVDDAPLEDASSSKADISRPVVLKEKPFVPTKRSRTDAVQILNTLRKGPPPPDKRPPQITADENPSSSSALTTTSLAATTERILAARRSEQKWLASARYIARKIENHKPADRCRPAAYSVLSEPSALERSYGITDLGQMSPITNAPPVVDLPDDMINDVDTVVTN